MESSILHETANLYLAQTRAGLEIRLSTATAAIVVGKPKDIDAGKRAMARLERYPANLRAMFAAY